MDKTHAPPGPQAGKATSPQAAAYADRVASKKYTAPVGGTAKVPIPPLDAPHMQGMTMADQARASRAPAPPSAGPAGSIFTGPQGANPFTATPPPMGRPGGQQAQVLPTDTLPPEAMKDSAYREGPGSAYAMTQQHLVAKYGVMRNGQRVPPSAFRAGKGPSPETLAALQEVEAFNQQLQRGAESATKRADDAQLEKELAGGPVGAARQAGGSAGSADPKIEAEMKAKLESMDKLELHRLQEMGIVDLLNNDAQKEMIEARCSLITLDEYVMNGFVRQRVPIVPGKYEVTFQSMALEDELKLKDLIAKEVSSVELGDKYLVDKYGYMGLAVGLHMVHTNGKDLLFPSHLNNEGVFDEKLFWEKFKKVLRLPFHLAASLAINFFWFEVRVRRLPRATKSEGVA